MSSSRCFRTPSLFVVLSHIISETCYRQHGQTYDAIGCIAWKLLTSGIGVKKKMQTALKRSHNDNRIPLVTQRGLHKTGNSPRLWSVAMQGFPFSHTVTQPLILTPSSPTWIGVGSENRIRHKLHSPSLSVHMDSWSNCSSFNCKWEAFMAFMFFSLSAASRQLFLSVYRRAIAKGFVSSSLPGVPNGQHNETLKASYDNRLSTWDQCKCNTKIMTQLAHIQAYPFNTSLSAVCGTQWWVNWDTIQQLTLATWMTKTQLAIQSN